MGKALRAYPRISKIFEQVRIILFNEISILTIIFIFGLILRLKGLTFQSLWYDELASVISSAPRLRFFDIISILQTDPHPPFFYITLHYWMTIFGYSEYVARIYVSIAGSLTIISTYVLGREAFNKRAGLIAALIVSLNYFNLSFSQEVRPYIFLYLFSTLSFAYFLKILRKRTVPNTLGYVIFTTLMLYTHYFGLVQVLAQLAYLGFYFLGDRRQSGQSSVDRVQIAKKFGISYFFIAMLYSPWIPTTLKMLKKSKHWVPKPRADFFIDLFNNFFAAEPYLVTIFGVLLLLLIFYLMIDFGHNYSRSGEQGSQTGSSVSQAEIDRLPVTVPVLFSWVFFTLFIPYVRSLMFVPMYYENYAIGTLAAVLVMIAISITLFRNSAFRALLITSIVLVSLTSIFLRLDYYNTSVKEDWRSIVKFIVKVNTQKYRDERIKVFSQHADKFEFYFNSFNKGITRISPSIDGIKSEIEKQENADKHDLKFWLILGHDYKPDSSVMGFIQDNFNQLEQADVVAGKNFLKAYLFEVKKGRVGASLTPTKTQ